MTLTVGELLALDWQRQETQIEGESVGIEADPVMGDERQSWVLGWSVLTARHDDALIAFSVEWQAQGNVLGTYADLYDFDLSLWDGVREGPVSLDICVESDGELPASITLIGESGDPLDRYEEADALDRLGKDLEHVWKEAVYAVLPQCPEPEDIDRNKEDTDMETITLPRDDARDVRFSGELVANVSSHHYEGPRNTRWTELNLYRTQGGKLVCQVIGRTCWQGEHERYAVHIANTDEELIEQLGTGGLAKDLYDEADIECVEHVR